MKHNFLFMLSLLAMLVCSSSGWASEIVAPTEPDWAPTSVALESGKVYYMYNVEPEMYLYNFDNALHCGGTPNIENAIAVEAVKADDGWTLKEVANGLYVSYANYSNYIGYNQLSQDSYWNITGTKDNYQIQLPETHSSYRSSNYVVYNNNYIRSIQSTWNTWKFIDAEAKERYLALTKLYTALQQANAFKVYAANYEDMYKHQANYSVSQLYDAYNSLTKDVSITNTPLVLSSSEYPMIVSDGVGDWKWYDSGKSQRSATVLGEGSTSMQAKFYVDRNAIFHYTVHTSSKSDVSIKVLIDGKIVRELNLGYEAYNQSRYIEDVTPGEHVVEWIFNKVNKNSSVGYIAELGIKAMDKITVSLLEPGSLGTEVLYSVDGLKDVKNLKVIGKMNSDDWEKVIMMSNLVDLDLSEAIITTVPEKALSRKKYNAVFGFLHRVMLPDGITFIGNGAFEGSYVEYVNIPSTVSSVGEYAFSETNIKNIVIPNSVVSLGEKIFYYCQRLRNVTLSSSLTSIPTCAFQECRALMECPLPEGIIEIAGHAFDQCNNLQQSLPSSLTSIGSYAYRDCYKLGSDNDDMLVIPSNVKSIGEYAFGYNRFEKLIVNSTSSIGEGAFYSNSGLREIELPTNYYDINAGYPFTGCDNVVKLTLRCPSLVTHDNNTLGISLSNVDLVVPDFLIPSYKLDSYWYNYKTISGFSSEDVQDWEINNPVKLNAQNRLLGTPNIVISGHNTRFPSLKIFGDNPQLIKNLRFGGYHSSYVNYPGQILCDSKSVSIEGSVQTNLYTTAKYWYFFSLPFDVKISEITHSAEGVQKAVRYYDGANRAEVGRTGSWKNYDADAVIPAGTGFIIQTNVNTWNYFHAIDNANKQKCVRNEEIVETLAVNNSENASNKGWNLVGNPWQCYYNNHNLNFTGPITVWDAYHKTYSAYSITDDEYAIRPNEAFFVQCPDAEHNTIGFPTTGRQLTNVIETQNAAKPMNYASSQRLLVNVKISDGENEDVTRIVLNEQASLGYEMACDAGKMMSMDASVPQIYSLDADGTQYAINERPTDSAVVELGFYAATNGTYTLFLDRCDAENVTLIDYETGIEQKFTSDYVFNAFAGCDNGRFALRFNAAETTGIEKMNTEDLNSAPCYNLSGQRVMRGTKGINIIGGRKIVNK